MTDAVFRSKLDAAIDLSDDGRWKAALKAFDRIVEAYPREMQPRFERAMVLLNLQRDLGAIADLEHILKHDPDYPGARKWYARTQRDRGKPMLAAETALEELQSQAPEHWSTNGQAWADCAQYFLEAGAPDRALEWLDVYFERYEGKQGYEVYAPAPYRLRALALLKLGRPQEALAAVERACADPHSVPADKFVRIRALAAIGEKERAVAELQQLQPEYEGTLAFVEAVADLKRLGVAIG
jgi:tetratricopeptide (TPR) repeat protein